LQIARALSPLLASIVLVGASFVPTGLGVLAGLSCVLLAWRELKAVSERSDVRLHR